MNDWLDSEKEKQARGTREHQHATEQKALYEREVQTFIDTNDTMKTFVESLSEYLDIARSANITPSTWISRAKITLFQCIRPETHYRTAIVREIDLSFSYERNGYVITLYEGYARYHYQAYIESGVVLKRDSKGDYRFETESYAAPSSPPSGWQKIERFGGTV